MSGAVSANITDVMVNITTILTLSSTSTVSEFGGTTTASAATVTAPVPTCALLGNNLIQNGDFECDFAPADSYDVFYWQGTDGLYAAAVSPGSDNSAQAISLSCDIGSMITPIWQTLMSALDPTYMLSFDYMVANVSSSDSITLDFDSYGSTSAQISAGGGSNVDSNNNAFYTWQSAVFAWQFSDVPELDISVGCNMPDAFGTFLVDNVAITALPSQPVGACDAQNDNLIANSDFEFDTAPADPVDIWCWTSYPLGSATPVSPGYGSAQAVSMTEGASLRYLGIELTNGGKYTIRFYYLDLSNGDDGVSDGAPININICDEYTSTLSTSDADSSWTFAMVVYRASCDATDVLVNSQSTILIDDFSIVLQPFGTCYPNSNNLLLNGDFECDDDVDYDTYIIAWYPYSDVNPVQAVMSYDENLSSQVAALSCQASTVAEIPQTINTPTIIGATYTLTLDYSWSSVAVDNPGDVALRVEASGGSSNNNFLLLVPDGSTSSSWANQGGTFTATDTSTTLTLTLICDANSNAQLYLDNLIIPPVAASDPSSPQAPTCAETNALLINGDFECDDADDFQFSIPGWAWDTSDPSAAVQAVTPGDDSSAQAVALSCGNSMTAGASIAQLSQYFSPSSDAVYQMMYNYNWASVEDDNSGDVLLQIYMGNYGPQDSLADYNIGYWQTATLSGQLNAGGYPTVSFTLICEQGAGGISGTVLIDNVSVDLLQPPTCAPTNEIIVNGDFECDDAEYFPSTIPGWSVFSSDSPYPIQATTPGDNSAQAVAFSCGVSTTSGGVSTTSDESFVEISQILTVQSDGTYQLTFTYDWDSVADGVQFWYEFGSIAGQVPYTVSSGSWQTMATTADLTAGEQFLLVFYLDCSGAANGASATMLLDSVSIGLPPCAPNPNEILLNGDFECDNAAQFPSTIPGWTTTGSNPSASVQAIAPGDNSGQAVALSCAGESTAATSVRLSQTFSVSTAATYHMTFSYYWSGVDDGSSNSVTLTSSFGSGTEPIIADESTLNAWQTVSIDSLLHTGPYYGNTPYSVSFSLACPASAGAMSATVWIDSVVIATGYF